MPRIIRLKEVCRTMGLSRASVYNRIHDGLIPKPCALGARAVGWPSEEIQRLYGALIAGKDVDSIKSLVRQMETERAAAA